VNNSRLDRTKEKVSEFVNQQKLPNMKNREKNHWEKNKNFRDLWDNIKMINILIIQVPEGEEREKSRKII